MRLRWPLAQPTGVKSFIVQTRVRGRMRKLSLGRFPETSLAEARKEAAAVLARVWTGEAVAPARKERAPPFRDFPARYRERRRSCWKPSSLKTFDTYIRGRLMPRFGNMRLDRIDHARVSAWFDAASAERPGAANRAFEILRAMLRTARQWGELAPDAPDPPLIRLDFLCKQKASGFNPTPAHAGPYLSSFTTNAQRRFPRTPARASDLSGGSRNGDGRMSGPRRWPATIVRRRQAGDRLTHPFLRLPQLIELLRVQPEFAGCPEEATRVWRPLSISMMRLPDYKINRIDELLPWNCSTAADPGPLTSALRIRRL